MEDFGRYLSGKTLLFISCPYFSYKVRQRFGIFNCHITKHRNHGVE